MWGVSLTRPMLLPVGTFSYTPCDVLGGEIITCPSCCFTWGVFLKFPMLFYVGSFSDTPDAVLRGEFLLHTPCYLMWEDSLTCRILFYVVSFFYITHTFFIYFLFFIIFFFLGNVSYTLRAVLCGGFSYITRAFWYRKHIFHALRYSISGISLAHPMQVYVETFSNSMHCVLSCEEFPWYSPCYFMLDVSLTILRAIY